jgi:hypothetical protein
VFDISIYIRVKTYKTVKILQDGNFCAIVQFLHEHQYFAAMVSHEIEVAAPPELVRNLVG